MDSHELEMASTTSFEKEALLWRVSGDVDEAKAVLAVFSMEARKLIAQLGLDIKRNDAFDLRTHAESLHECASSVSAMTVKYFAHRIAYSAERYDFAAAGRLLPKLAFSLHVFEAHLRRDGRLPSQP